MRSHRNVERIVVPFVAGEADLELLRAVSAFVAPTFDDHIAAIEAGGQALAEVGVRVDLVPLWAPLFLVWCAEAGLDPAAADAFERWAQRHGPVFVTYTHYECGPIGPLVELEQVRSRALRSILADRASHSEQAVASVWAVAAAFLDMITRRAAPGSELDVSTPAWDRAAHWHIDGSCCSESSPTLDHVHSALMESLAFAGDLVLVEPGKNECTSVRVWDLGPAGIRPLTAEEAGYRCQPQPGAVLDDAWGHPVSSDRPPSPS